MHQYLTSPPQNPLDETYSAQRSPIPTTWMGKEKERKKERELGRGVLWSPKNP